MRGGVVRPQGFFERSGGFDTEFTFSSSFENDWGADFEEAQIFMDSEILRLSEPFTPLLTGTLIRSGILTTIIGSGLVTWNTPYARHQYYLKKEAGSQTGPLRGPHWFERMKAIYRDYLVAGAKERIKR